VEYEMPALAITDHGVLSGAIKFYKKSLKYGIKPIIGCELYVAPGGRTKKSAKEKYHHLLLLAKNKEGYKNLIKLVSLGYLEGFYYKPRVDKELLRSHSKGLIATSGCVSSEIPRLLSQGKRKEAALVCEEFCEIFDDFFIEIQNHGLEEEKELNKLLRALAKGLSIPLVATNDVHYLKREDKEAHEILLNIQTRNSSERRTYEGEEYYFKSPLEMTQAFQNSEEALENTWHIVKLCNLELEFDKTHLPTFNLPPGKSDSNRYLEELVVSGAKERFGKLNSQIKERLDFEMTLIKEMGYADYFLIVQDFVNFAKGKGIPVGPGRGSAAGSLVSYCLGITDVDPLKYGLLFERFLNPHRVSLPDIDIDFCMRRRDEVIQYVMEKYGQERVSQIVTFDTLAARSAVRDVARVLGVPLKEADRIAKLIPFGYTLSEALASTKLGQLYESDHQVRRLIEIAKKLEGLPRNPSTHAAGVVISKEGLMEHAPLLRLSDGSVVTQYDMKDLEEIGLLKMDFLGLRNLTIIDDTLKNIRKDGGEIKIGEIPLDDSKTYALFQKGETIGVFQFEGSGARDLLRRLKPSCFDDIRAASALIRPGPLESGMADSYIKRKQGKQKVNHHPQLEFLKETYGLPIYQEQLLLMVQVLAGFSLAEADVLRVAIGKKIKSQMHQLKQRFLKGCRDRGIDKDQASKLFKDIEKFARYGFNKSHSTAYALISYWTAYLKANYPTHYMAALLTSVSGAPEKISEYIQECHRIGIKVLPPDINESDLLFTPHQGKIRFGLAAIKHVGSGAVLAILKARRVKDFSSFFDFCQRVDLEKVNREVIENLIKAGAFDRFGTRRSLLGQVEQGLELGQVASKERKSGQQSFFAYTYTPKKTKKEFPQEKLLEFEKELLGLYVSGHPLLKYEELLKMCRSHSIGEIKEIIEKAKKIKSKDVRLGGRIDTLKVINTHNGKKMAFLQLEDLKSRVDVTVFPPQYEKYSHLLKQDGLIFLNGKLELRGSNLQVVADHIRPLEEIGETVELHLSLSVDKVNEELLERIRKIFANHEGKVSVYIQVKASDGERWVKVGKKFYLELSSEVKEELERILGKGKVKVVRKK
jgi:DNA polymerase-3 subunit alpha